MPVYSLTSRKYINDTNKEKLANLFTDVHCELTGAPEQFVHVFFSDGIPITGGKDLYIHANVRAGRTADTVTELSKQLVKKSATILNVAASQVTIFLIEIEAKWCIEGGYIMPEPGEEDAWFEKVNAALAKREKELI